MRVLVNAWHAIRRNAETSRTRSTREEARRFGHDLPHNLRKLQDRLRAGYKFEKAYGATPAKGPGKSGKRPIVVATLCDRVVQRAILDVLQNAKHLLRIAEVLATPTSIGGIPGRGVDTAIELFDQHVKAGYTHVAGSDIAGFFTKIPKGKVIDFLRQEVEDERFIDLVEAALKVELRNAGKLSPDDLHLFPTGPDGVAQGCPLSALAGNIVLRDFDRAMNARGLVCIRYIDDFIIMGRKLDNVAKGMAAASDMLKAMKMDIYDPLTSPAKAFIGRIGEKHVFLGRELIPSRYPPAKAAQDKLKKSIDDLISEGQKTIDKVRDGRPLKPMDRSFASTVVTINHAARGWRGSFKSTNCPATFETLDEWISRRLGDFERYLNSRTSGQPFGVRQRALGVARMASSSA